MRYETLWEMELCHSRGGRGGVSAEKRAEQCGRVCVKDGEQVLAAVWLEAVTRNRPIGRR